MKIFLNIRKKHGVYLNYYNFTKKVFNLICKSLDKLIKKLLMDSIR